MMALVVLWKPVVDIQCLIIVNDNIFTSECIVEQVHVRGANLANGAFMVDERCAGEGVQRKRPD
jgi:hypothetical protein